MVYRMSGGEDGYCNNDDDDEARQQAARAGGDATDSQGLQTGQDL